MAISQKSTETIECFYDIKGILDETLSGEKQEMSHLQNYLYFTYGPVFNYTDAIIKLCEHGRNNAASALLRSLFEVHINIIYHQEGDTEKKLSVSAKQRLEQLEKAFRGINALIKKYPNQSSPETTGLFNQEYLAGALAELGEQKEALIKTNSLTDADTNPALIDKAICCDGENVTGAEPGHFQSLYHLIYRQLSSAVHLDIDGLGFFTDQDDEGKYIFREKYDEDLLIHQSVSICIALVKDLYLHNVLTGDRIAHIDTLEKLTSTE